MKWFWPRGQKEVSPRDQAYLLAKDGDWEAAMRLTEVHRWTSSEDYGQLLIIAIKQNEEQVAMDLLRRGASPNTCSQDGRPALIHAIEHCADEVAVALMVQGADMNCTTPSGTPALTVAMRRSKFELLATMVKRGARIDSQVIKMCEPYQRRADSRLKALLSFIRWPSLPEQHARTLSTSHKQG